MRRTTQKKLEEIVRRIIKEEYWKPNHIKSVGDWVNISDDQGGGSGKIVKIVPKDGEKMGLVKMDDGTTQEFTMEYLNSLS